jgi:hypothetical protein
MMLQKGQAFCSQDRILRVNTFGPEFSSSLYGLRRPSDFIQHYSSVQSLLDRIPIFKPAPRRGGVLKGTMPKSRSIVSVPWDDVQVPPELKDVVIRSSGTPFDANLDILFRYKGIKKIFFEVIEKESGILLSWISMGL